MSKLNSQKKVKDSFQIDETLLSKLVDYEIKNSDKDFFQKSSKFYFDVKERSTNTLSDKQRDWLSEIASILHDRASKISQGYDQVKQGPKQSLDSVVVLPPSTELTINESFLSKIKSAIKNIFN